MVTELFVEESADLAFQAVEGVVLDPLPYYPELVKRKFVTVVCDVNLLYFNIHLDNNVISFPLSAICMELLTKQVRLLSLAVSCNISHIYTFFEGLEQCLYCRSYNFTDIGYPG